MMVKVYDVGLFIWLEWVDVFGVEFVKDGDGVKDGISGNIGIVKGYYDYWLVVFEKLFLIKGIVEVGQFSVLCDVWDVVV